MSEKIKPVPHKHASVIKAWADGRVVQCKNSKGEWFDLDCPTTRRCVPPFDLIWEYRIKPEPTDLERYGVCVGDLWLLEEGNVFFNYLVTRISNSPYHAEGIMVGTGMNSRKGSCCSVLMR